MKNLSTYCEGLLDGGIDSVVDQTLFWQEMKKIATECYKASIETLVRKQEPIFKKSMKKISKLLDSIRSADNPNGQIDIYIVPPKGSRKDPLLEIHDSDTNQVFHLQIATISRRIIAGWFDGETNIATDYKQAKKEYGDNFIRLDRQPMVDNFITT